MDRSEPPQIEVARKNLPVIVHHRRERQRLAAGAGAQVDHLLAGLGAGQQRSKLRALVLHLDMALEVSGLGVNGRALGVGRHRDAQAERRPWRGLRRVMCQLIENLVAVGLERIDPQVEGRAVGKCRAFRHAVVAENTGERQVEPFGKIAGDMGRRIIERTRCQRGVLGRA